MKKHFVAFFFVLLSLSSFSQDNKQILQLLEDQRLAWNKGDIEGYMQGYWKSDSLVFVGKSGPKYGWTTTLENYKKGYPDKAAMGYLTFSIIKVELLGSNNAWVLGAWHLKREKDGPQGYFTLILRRIGGKWLVVSDHSS